jgi:hypothetical protein
MINEVFLKWMIRKVLLEDDYPEKARIVAHLPELTPILHRFFLLAIAESETDLQLLGYTPALAKETALNVVGKVAAFFSLFLLRQNLDNWLPEDFRTLPEDQREQRLPALLRLIEAFTQLANKAYYTDEYLDRPIGREAEAALGGYEQTAFPSLLNPIETYLDAVIPEIERSTPFVDLLKYQLLQLVDLYVDEFPCQWEELKNNPQFIQRLRKAEYLVHGPHLVIKGAGMQALLPLVKYLSLIGDAYRDEEGRITETGRRVMQDGVLPLSDILTYELLGKKAYQAVQNGNPDQLLPLPTDFKGSLAPDMQPGDSGLFYGRALDALYLSMINSQGLVMIANDSYLRRSFISRYDPAHQRYMLKLNPRHRFRPVRDLLMPSKNRQLRYFVSALQVLVRMGDDVGDYESDLHHQAPNLLSLPAEAQQNFLQYCQRIDHCAGTEIAKLMIELQSVVDQYGTVRPNGPDDSLYWSKALRLQLEYARRTLTDAGRFGVDEDASALDYQSYVEDLYSIAKGAVEMLTLANDELFTQAMKSASGEIT